MKQFTKENLFGVREPKLSFISDHKIVIVVDPDADLWQETYYNNILKSQSSNYTKTRQIKYLPGF
ncbi:MAG: hypothetical protein QM211_00415 [Bacillota bacterium]|jgi:regulation of enolase protein 1 (concanavalin A-like superfamily)|nr:hypothetical protein [Bacillota bacterium]